MGNCHPGWMVHLVEGAFRDRDFSGKFWQEQGDEAMRMSEARKKLGARVESNRITPLGIDIPIYRSAITFAEAWGARVRGSSFEIPFPFISLIQLIANKPAIGRSSDVEQWKHIPRRAASGTQAFR
jgi:hypothetical protein